MCYAPGVIVTFKNCQWKTQAYIAIGFGWKEKKNQDTFSLKSVSVEMETIH